MTHAALDEFVRRHGWHLMVFVVAAAVAWTTLQAQVRDKADRDDVLRVERKVDAVLYLVCKQYPKDSVCRQ